MTEGVSDLGDFAYGCIIAREGVTAN